MLYGIPALPSGISLIWSYQPDLRSGQICEWVIQGSSNEWFERVLDSSRQLFQWNLSWKFHNKVAGTSFQILNVSNTFQLLHQGEVTWVNRPQRPAWRAYKLISCLSFHYLGILSPEENHSRRWTSAAVTKQLLWCKAACGVQRSCSAHHSNLWNVPPCSYPVPASSEEHVAPACRCMLSGATAAHQTCLLWCPA